jgi:hypothetical protein
MVNDHTLISNRRAEIAQEVERLEARLSEMRSELSDLETAERVLSRLSGAKRNAPSASDAAKPQEAPSAKPAGTPTLREITLEALGIARSKGRAGYAPKDVREFALKKYGFNMKSQANTIAWRMWKDGIILKDEETGLYSLPAKETAAPTVASDAAVLSSSTEEEANAPAIVSDRLV